MGHYYTEYEMSDDDFAWELDMAWGEVEIMGYTYGQGTALRKLDPIAFRCAKADYGHWQCEHCGTLHTDEAEAELCCDEDEDYKGYDCPVCGDNYKHSDNASACCADKDND